MPKHVVIMACEAIAAAISAPFSSHGGDFFMLHRRAGRSFRDFLVYVLYIYINLKAFFVIFLFIHVLIFKYAAPARQPPIDGRRGPVHSDLSKWRLS